MSTDSLPYEAVIGFKGGIKNGLIIHPDNQRIIFALGSTIVVRNVKTMKQEFLRSHDYGINTMTISKDGKYLASGEKSFMGAGADVIIWDMENLQEVHKLSLHKMSVSSISFSHNNSYVATIGCQDDNTLVVWDINTGKAICGTPASQDPANVVLFFNESEFHLVTAGVNHIRLWNLDIKNKKVRPTPVSLSQLKRNTNVIALNPNDTSLYCGTATGDIIEIDTFRALLKKIGPPKHLFPMGVTIIHMMSSGDQILGTGEGLVVRLQAGSMRILGQCSVLGSVTSIAITMDGSSAYVGTVLSNIYWLDLTTLIPELRNTSHPDRINSITFPHGSSTVFATTSIGDIRIWNSATRQELLRIQVPGVECLCLDFPRNGHSIISGWSDGKIRSFTPQSGKLIYVINDAHRNGTTSMITTSDCDRIISGGMEGEVRVWRVGSASHQVMESSMKEHRARVWCIRIKADGTKSISASSDGSVIVWDMSTRSRSLCLFENTLFKSIVYHPDESQIITSGSDRRLSFWDTFDGQAIRVLEASKDGEVNSLSISQSGSHFFSAGEDRLVKLWDYDEGLCKFIGVGHSAPITAIAISPDQKFTVSVGNDGAIFIWKTPETLLNKMKDNLFHTGS